MERREVLAAELSALYLVNDNGASASDLLTTDARLGGTVGGTWLGTSAVVEFDHNANGIADGSRVLTSSGQSFAYDPRWFSSLATGPVSIGYRLIERDGSGNPLVTGPWNTFSFTLDESPIGPAEIEVEDDGGAVSIPHSTGQLDFGTTAPGIPISRTFTIRNYGDETLTLDTQTLGLPAGFSLQTPPAGYVAPFDSTSLTVRFDAVALGTYSGSFSLRNSDSDENPYLFTISGTVASLEPEMNVQDQASAQTISDGSGQVNFGATPLGLAVTRSFIIQNSGSGELVLSPPVLPAGFSLAGTIPTSIAPGSSETFDVTLDANVEGNYSGQVSIESNDGDENPYNFTISGIVNSPQPEIAIEDSAGYLGHPYPIADNSGSLSLGTTTVGVPVTKWLTIVNSGEGELQLSPPTLPAGFSLVAGSFPSSVAASSSQSFGIRFDAATVGTASGQISIPTNDSDENPYNFTLSATANPSTVEIEIGLGTSSSGLTDGSSVVGLGTTSLYVPLTQSFTIRNTGNGYLTLGVSEITLPPGFSLVEPPASTLTAGETAGFTVQFDAYELGDFSGQISIPNNDADENPFNFTLTATAAPPPPEIEVLDENFASLASGSGSLNFGSVPLGTPAERTLIIQNNGESTLQLNVGSLVLPAGFSLVAAFDAAVEPYGSTQLIIRADGAALGSFSGPVSFATNDSDENPFIFQAVASVVVAEPEIEAGLDLATGGLVSGTSVINFGHTEMQSPVAKRVTIRNSGTVPLEIDVAAIQFAAGFSLLEPPISSIEPGDTTTLQIQMDAVASGSFSGSITIPNNDADENPFTLLLAGHVTPTAPELNVLLDGESLTDGEDEIDFGTAIAGTPAAITITLQNLGSAPLVFDAAGLVVPAGYSLAESLPPSIEAGESAALMVNLNAATPGEYTGTFILATNDEDEGLFEIVLTGVVQPANPHIEILDEADQPLAPSSALDFRATTPGVAVTRTLTIVNSGTTPLEIDLQSLVLPAGYSLVMTPAATVEPGGWTPLAIQLDAEEFGDFNGQLSLTSNDSAANPFILQLNGSVQPPPPEIVVFAGNSLNPLETGATLQLGQTLIGQPVVVRGYIRNEGTGLLTIDVASIAVPAGYALTISPATTVQPGQWTEFTLELTAAASGTFSGTVSISNSDPDENPFQFTVEGQVSAPAPRAAVRYLGQSIPATGSAIRSLGVAVVNVPVRGSFSIANDGTAPLEISNITLPAAFTLVSAPAAAIAAGNSANLVVELTAASTGVFEGNLGFATNDSAASSFTVPIRGTVVASATQIEVRHNTTLLASGSTLDLGTITAGTATSVTLEIRNVGSNPLVIDPAAIALPAGVSLTGIPVDTVAPGDATNLTVSLDTSLPMNLAGTLSFSSNGSSAAFRVVLLADAIPSPTSLAIGTVQLANDDGASATDRVTTDPRLSIQVVNAAAEELTQLRVEVDLDNNDLPEASAAVGTDGTSIAQLDERNLAAGQVVARVRLNNPVTGASSDWQSFTFTYELPDMRPTVVLQLVEDTGTAGDLVTANPTVSGTVNVLAGSSANLEVAIDLNGDGKADYSTRTDALGGFTIDPRQVLPRLVPGQLTVRVQARQFDPRRQTLAANDWVGLTFEYVIVRQLPQVQNLQAEQGAADLAFGKVRISGNVIDPDTQTRFLSVEFDVDGDGVVDGEAFASPTDGGPFEFVVDATQLPPGEHTVQVRGVKLVRQSAERLVGGWQGVTFQNSISQPSPPVLSDLAFSPSSNAAGSTQHAIVGRVSRDGVAAGGATIEYDLNADGQRDGLAFSRHDADGSFRLDQTRHGLAPGPHTVQLRARVWDPVRRQMVSSTWQEYTFTIAQSPTIVLPSLQSLALAVDTGTPGDGITSQPKVAGVATWADGALGDFVVEYELLGDNVGTGQIIALVALDGAFVLNLAHMQFADADIELRLRARGWNDNGRQLVGPWESFAFTLSSAANLLPVIATVGLQEDTGTAGDNSSRNATLVGSVNNPDGSAAVVPVQFDLNGDGSPDGFVNTKTDGTFVLDLNARFATAGLRTVALRAGEFDAAGQYVYGNWSNVTFNVERAGTPPTAVVTSLRLFRDTGDADDDGITSDPRITGVVVLSDGSFAAGLPVEIDYTGDGYSDEIAVTDPTGGGFLADLRDRIHEAGPVTVKFRAGVPADTDSGFLYGEWTSFAFEFQLDPLVPSTTPEASLPPLEITVNPPLPPSYAEYYQDPILFAYGELYGLLAIPDVPGGQFDLFATRFQPHPLGNVSTVVTVNESDTQTYPNSAPDGGTLTVTTTLNSTLTTNALLNGDGTWTVSEILVSTYLIVKSYSSTSGLSYNFTQSGSHDYTFTASGDSDDALYSLTETRLDEWSHDRDEPDSTNSAGQTVSVVSHGDSSQGFIFIAGGFRLFPSGGSVTEHEDWDYTTAADSAYSVTTTTGKDDIVEKSSHSSTGHDDLLTDLVASVRTTTRTFLHENKSEASVTDGASWSSGDSSSSWDRTVATESQARWQGTITTVDDGMTVSRTGNYDQEHTLIYDWDVDSDWSGSEVVAAPLGSVTRLLSNTHHYDKQEKYENKQKWQIMDEAVEPTSGWTQTTIAIDTLDHWSTDEKQTLTTASAGTTVSHNIQRLLTTDNTYSWLQQSESNYSVSSSGKTTTSSSSALTTRLLQEEKETETETLNASGKITATGLSTYLGEISTDITTDKRSGDSGGDTWLSESEAGERNGVWMHSLTSTISGTSGGGASPLVTFKFGAQSQSSGSGKQTYSSNAYEESTSGKGYSGLATDAAGKATITIPGIGTITPDYQDRTAQMSGVYSWDYSSDVTVAGSGSPLPGVSTSFTNSQSSTDKGTGGFAGSMQETMTGGDPATRTLLGNSNSLYNGNITFSSSHDSKSAGVLSAAPGQITILSTSSQGSTSGTGTYSGKTNGTASGTGGSFTAKFTEEETSNSNYTFKSKGDSLFATTNASSPSYTSSSLTTGSWTDDGSGSDSRNFTAETNTALDGSSTYQSTDTVTSSVSGDPTTQNHTETSSSGTTTSDGYSSTFSNSSTSDYSTSGHYTSGSKTVTTKVNAAVTIDASSDFSENGTTKFSGSTNGSSTTTQDDLEGATHTNATTSSTLRTGTGTYASTRNSASLQTPTSYSSSSNTTYSNTEKGDRSANDSSSHSFFGMSLPYDMGDPDSTTSGSNNWGGSTDSTNEEKAKFNSSESGWTKESTTGISSASSRHDESSEDENGTFSYTRKVNRWALNYLYTSGTSKPEGSETETTTSSSNETEQDASSSTEGSGTFTSLHTEIETVGTGADIQQTKSSSTREESGKLSSSSKTKGDNSSEVHTKTPAYIILAPGENQPPDPLFATDDTTTDSHSLVSSSRDGTFTAKSNSSETVTYGIREALAHAEYSEKGTTKDNSSYEWTKTHDTNNGLGEFKAKAGATTHSHHFEKSTTNGTGEFTFNSLSDDVTPLGKLTTSTSESHATDSSTGTLTTETGDQTERKGTNADGVEYDSSANDSYTRNGNFTASGKEDSYLTNHAVTKSHEESHYEESGTFTVLKSVVSTGEFHGDKEVEKAPGAKITIHIDFDQLVTYDLDGNGIYSSKSDSTSDLDAGKTTRHDYSESGSTESGTIYEYNDSTNVSTLVPPPAPTPPPGTDPPTDEEKAWTEEKGKQTRTSTTIRDAKYSATSSSSQDTLDAVTESESFDTYDENGERFSSSGYVATSVTFESQASGNRKYKVEKEESETSSTKTKYTAFDDTYSYSKTGGDSDWWHESDEVGDITEKFHSRDWTKTTGKINSEGTITDPATGKEVPWYPDGNLDHTAEAEYVTGYTETGKSTWNLFEEQKLAPMSGSLPGMMMLMPTRTEKDTYTGNQVGNSSDREILDEVFTKTGKTNKHHFDYELKNEIHSHAESQSNWTHDTTYSETTDEQYKSEGKETSNYQETGSSWWDDETINFYKIDKVGAGLIQKVIDGIVQAISGSDVEAITKFSVTNKVTKTDVGGGTSSDKEYTSDEWTKDGKHTYGGNSESKIRAAGVEWNSTDDVVTQDTKVETTGVSTTTTFDGSLSRTYSSDAYSGGKDWNTTTAADGKVTSWGEAFALSAESGGSDRGRIHGTVSSGSGTTTSHSLTTGFGNSRASGDERHKFWYADGTDKKTELEWTIVDSYTFRETHDESHTHFTGSNGDYVDEDRVNHMREAWGVQEKKAIERVKFSLNWLIPGFDYSVPFESTVSMRINYSARGTTFTNTHKSQTTTSPWYSWFGLFDTVVTRNESGKAGSFAYVADVSKSLNLPSLPGGILASLPTTILSKFGSWPEWHEWGQSSWSSNNATSTTDTPNTDSSSTTTSKYANGGGGKLKIGNQEGEVQTWSISNNTSNSTQTPGGNWQGKSNSSSHTKAHRTGGVDAWDVHNNYSYSWSKSTTPGLVEERTETHVTIKDGNQLKETVTGSETITTYETTEDAYGNPITTPHTETHSLNAGPYYSDLPEVDWTQPALDAPGTVEHQVQYILAVGSEVSMFLMENWQAFLPFGLGAWGFFQTPWYAASQMRSSLDQTLSNDFQFQSVFEWASYNFVTTFVDHDRLLENRYGNEWLDNLAIAGLMATEIVGYVDPTPLSDSLNAGLNALEGNYGAAAMSLAGAFIPGGGDKAAKGASRIGGNIMEGMGDMARRANKAIDCNSSNRILSTMGGMLGRCFVGDTEVVLDFAPEQTPAAAATGQQFAAPDILVTAGVAAIAIGIGGNAVLATRRREEEEAIVDRLIEEGAVGDLIPGSGNVPPPDLDPAALDELCDRLFAEAASDDWASACDPPTGNSSAVAACQNASPSSAVLAVSRSAPVKQHIARAEKRPVSSIRTCRRAAMPDTRLSGVAGRTWLFAWLLLGLGFLAFAAFSWTNHTASSPSGLATTVASAAPAEAKYVTQKIKDLQVGTWVLADNPEEDGEYGVAYGEYSPVDLRVVRVRMVKPDGTLLHIDLIDSQEWLDELNAAPGSSMYLEYEELKVAGDAEILTIQPCPAIPPRPSPQHFLVTAKFEHEASEVIDVYVDTIPDPIGVTPNHPFWSEDRQEFVQAGDLQVGERLLSADGTVRHVTGIIPRVASEPVYNLEVEYEHVYYVSRAGVLVHNAKNYDMHHSIPRGIQKRLPAKLRKDPDIIGRPGLPNRMKVERGRHRQIHGGSGYKQKNGVGGGHYNNRFHKEIKKRGGYDRVSKRQVLNIRDRLVDEFDL